MIDTGNKARFPVVAPNGHLASVLLAFLTTAGLFYVNIMPALVSGLVEGLGFSKQAAGHVASANVYGAALGAFVAVFAIKHLSWRPTAIAALLILIALDVFSSTIADPTLLTVMRFIHGSTGGFLVGVGFSVIARTHAPDRSFGMLLIVQYGLGGLGLMFLPKLVPLYGTQVLFFALIAFSFVTLLMVPFMGTYAPKEKTALSNESGGEDKVYLKPLVMALFAVFFFQAANMGLAAYVIELGKSFGLKTGSISTTLGLANWIAVIGAVLVYGVGTNFGRLLPLMGGLVLTAVGMILFRFSGEVGVFFAANIITGITWAFLIPYLLGMCSAFDGHGRMAALSGFFSKMGLASGPFIAAQVVGDDNYNLIINLAVSGIILCTLAAFMPARLLDQKEAAYKAPDQGVLE
ncbi:MULTISPECIES: MFS transporter [Kordiimonas]|jgi:predicted MFS family arabinose efflux permease|uniref:MFS transporter n=1 Tax=Kordiimonas TaxID=288021 RepID=UPI00257E0F09|nr:MFS transporter [Kordiimonas sp. UBA4487]